ncbi:tyrosine-type recombinase/integrase [Paenibacillus sp. UMB7766-LJ446]|uniref:tyrosine-type recombinase/integrase n=1 Tax=Paenibacillus sp. UMB7766-LJ446 TaxID=3046313 RepID=UPI0023D8D884|nr:tyrosine-type recombinase/integrase [Paenibacillus sp. UMB7766-LJ446]MDK8188682.1 tyrosine-type recombinase/integrase [Paenibacillus sp. UMB7766-LJ446]
MARNKKYPGVYERSDTNDKSYYFLVTTLDPKTGKRKQKRYGGYNDPAVAYKELIDFKNKQHKGTYIEASKMTLKDWLEQWLNEKELSIKKVTLRSYKHRIESINEEFGMVPLFTISKDIFNDVHRTLRQKNKVIFNGRTKIKTKEKLSSRTIHDTLKVLKMALLQAYRDEKIPKNVTASYKLPPVNSKAHNVLKPNEVYQLLEAANGDPQFCAIYLALTTGMRESEILGLTWDAVDFDNRTIMILRTLDHEDEDNAVSDGTKTHSSRRPIEFDDEIIEVLQAQKRFISSNKKLAGELYRDNNLVCPTSIGTPMNPSNLRRTLDRLTKKAGVTRVTVHELRHSHATHLLMAGVDAKITASRLGHSSTRVTNDIYQHVIKGMQQEALKKYREKITPKK